MIYVLAALMLSYLCGYAANVDLILFDAREYSYVLFRLLQALVFLLPALLFSFIGLRLVRSGENLNGALVCILAMCMVITAMFNLLMVNPFMYSLLSGIRDGNEYNWSKLYSAVEVLIAFIVGGHGLSYLAHMGDFTDRGVKAPINPDLDHWTGKYK